MSEQECQELPQEIAVQLLEALRSGKATVTFADDDVGQRWKFAAETVAKAAVHLVPASDGTTPTRSEHLRRSGRVETWPPGSMYPVDAPCPECGGEGRVAVDDRKLNETERAEMQAAADQWTFCSDARGRMSAFIPMALAEINDLEQRINDAERVLRQALIDTAPTGITIAQELEAPLPELARLVAERLRQVCCETDATRYRALRAELERSGVGVEIASAEALDAFCDALEVQA